MSYGALFGKAAIGLGLERSSEDEQQAVEDYLANPADAFSRAAARMNPPGEIITSSEKISHLVRPINPGVRLPTPPCPQPSLAPRRDLS